MTPSQKNYFTWLVLRNAETIAMRANSFSRGTAVIDKAFAKFKALGLPVQMGKDSMEMRRESIAILGRLLGVRLLTLSEARQMAEERNYDLDEPF